MTPCQSGNGLSDLCNLLHSGAKVLGRARAFRRKTTLAIMAGGVDAIIHAAAMA